MTAFAFQNPQWYAWSASATLPWTLNIAIPTLTGLFFPVAGLPSRRFR